MTELEKLKKFARELYVRDVDSNGNPLSKEELKERVIDIGNFACQDLLSQELRDFLKAKRQTKNEKA